MSEPTLISLADWMSFGKRAERLALVLLVVPPVVAVLALLLLLLPQPAITATSTNSATGQPRRAALVIRLALLLNR
jgi:hypothetical protein